MVLLYFLLKSKVTMLQNNYNDAVVTIVKFNIPVRQFKRPIRVEFGEIFLLLIPLILSNGSNARATTIRKTLQPLQPLNLKTLKTYSLHQLHPHTLRQPQTKQLHHQALWPREIDQPQSL